MSTNPFRRSSLKDPGSSTARFTSHTFASPNPTAPLAIETRVASSSQKHVNFASPPDLISPVSYPPSPESTRFSPGLQTALPVGQATVDHGRILAGDPLTEIAPDEDADPALEQAQQNARSNSMIEAYKSAQGQRTREEAVRDTLSRFAGPPRKPFTTRALEESTENNTSKQTLDVDAFKRLLLTGESGTSTPPATSETGVAGTPAQNASENSSIGDTSSLSQQSVSETASTTVAESPRPSYLELEEDRVALSRRGSQTASTGPNTVTDIRKKPPLPKPRHGKLLQDNITSDSGETNMSHYIDKTTSNVPSVAAASDNMNHNEFRSTTLGPFETKKTPPAPPLARRKSQTTNHPKPVLTRNSSSRTSISTTSETPNTPPLQPRAAPPPPPPTRRHNSITDRRMSTDLPSTVEEDDESLRPGHLDLTSNMTVPIPPSVKRMSVGPANVPPPPPPPRRVRRSSRSSIDSQRPSTSSLDVSSTMQDRTDDRRTSDGGVSPEAPTSSYAVDIMADLAALQREVDAARRYA